MECGVNSYSPKSPCFSNVQEELKGERYKMRAQSLNTRRREALKL